MLIEFGVGNYRSFHEDQVLSLVASNDDEHPGNLIPAEKFNLLKTVGLFGANASGKSNLIRAMDFMKRFVRDSATRMNVGDTIDVVPFRLSGDSRNQPSFFEVTLLLDQARYRYGFTVARERVHDEWLVAYPKGRAQRWCERRFNRETGETDWSFRGVLRRHGELLKERTRDNGLVLSRGAELNVAELIPLFEWFRVALGLFDLSKAPLDRILERAAWSLLEDADFQRRAKPLLEDADFGIRDLRINEQTLAKAHLRRKLGRPISADFRRSTTAEDASPIVSVHTVPGTGEEVSFDFGDAESNGTHRCFALAGLWIEALRDRRVIVVDELDCSMHPMLTRKLVEFFQNPEESAAGAQLIFATHDTSLMDQSLFRRDQIWLVEKNASQASRLFSLYDFKDKPRKGEALEKRYLAGRYGGVPVFGPILENLGTD